MLTAEPTDVKPQIESSLFVDKPEARFAIGLLAVGNTVIPGREEEFRGYALLRGNVYGKELHFTPIEELNPDGTELNVDDIRSAHFGIIENAFNNKRVTGAMRLIIKTREMGTPLPVEEHYPEAFTNRPASFQSTEVSRVIARHEDHRLQRSMKWLLFAAGVTYVIDNRLGPVYGAVEEFFARALKYEGVPFDRLADAKFVQEFNSTKLPIRIDVANLAQTIETSQLDMLKGMQISENGFWYAGTHPQQFSKSA